MHMVWMRPYQIVVKLQMMPHILNVQHLVCELWLDLELPCIVLQDGFVDAQTLLEYKPRGGVNGLYAADLFHEMSRQLEYAIEA